MKKQEITLIALVAGIVIASTAFSGCAGGIFEEPAPVDAIVPVAEEPEPEEVAPPEPVEPEKSAWEMRFETWPMAFGFANEEGSRLIHPFYDYDEPDETETENNAVIDSNLYDEEYEPENYPAGAGFDPDMFSLAIGTYSEIWPIYFSKWQDETRGNNGRENANNFENLPGFVFAQKEWKLTDNKTYLMTGMDTLIDSMLAIFPPGGWKGNTPAMADETVASIEKYMNRGVVWAKSLAVTMDGGQVGIVLFERQDNDMLFSIVYMDERKSLFWNNPAEYDETSTWRADAGEEPGRFEPLLLARFQEGLLLILTWRAPEGETVVVLYEEGGRFVQADDLFFARYRP